MFTLLLGMTGLAIYGFYEHRRLASGREDPLACHEIETSDQISAFFALTELPDGCAGLLVAGVLGSTMSVFSGGINAACASLELDLLTNALGWRLGEQQAVRRSKVLSLVLSVLVVALALGTSHISGLVRLGIIATALCAPATCAFLLGICSTRTNMPGVLAGLVSSALITGYLSVTNIACDSGATHSTACDGVLAGARISVFWNSALSTIGGCAIGYLVGREYHFRDVRSNSQPKHSSVVCFKFSRYRFAPRPRRQKRSQD